MIRSFLILQANGGIDTETSYPYDGEEEQCHFSRGDVGATDKGATSFNITLLDCSINSFFTV